MDVLLLGNILSTLGALLLLFGYFKISVKGDEQKGLFYSGIGSIVMCLAFYILKSPAFLFLNIIWTFISFYGLFKRKKEGDEPYKRNFVFITLVYVFLVAPGALFVILKDPDIVSWFSILIILIAYFLFSSKKILKYDYMVFYIFSCVLSIYHLIDIQNYASLCHTALSITLSVYGILKSVIRKSEFAN